MATSEWEMTVDNAVARMTDTDLRELAFCLILTVWPEQTSEPDPIDNSDKIVKLLKHLRLTPKQLSK